MRRLVLVSFLLLALAALPSAAQRGGLHAVGGRGMAVPHSVGSRGYAPHPAAINHGGMGGYGMRGGHNGFYPHGHGRGFNNFHHHRFAYFPYAYYPVFGWDWDWDSSSYDYQQQQQSDYDQQLALQGEVQYLQQQVSELRQDQQAQQDDPPPTQSSSSATALKTLDPGPPTTLVFRDGKRMETQNYAIVGDTMWLMADGRMKKFPLSELDREATLKSNEERGVEFRVP